MRNPEQNSHRNPEQNDSKISEEAELLSSKHRTVASQNRIKINLSVSGYSLARESGRRELQSSKQANP